MAAVGRKAAMQSEDHVVPSGGVRQAIESIPILLVLQQSRSSEWHQEDAQQAQEGALQVSAHSFTYQDCLFAYVYMRDTAALLRDHALA